MFYNFFAGDAVLHYLISGIELKRKTPDRFLSIRSFLSYLLLSYRYFEADGQVVTEIAFEVDFKSLFVSREVDFFIASQECDALD